MTFQDPASFPNSAFTPLAPATGPALVPVPGGTLDAATLRELCLAALGDVPASDRKAVLARVGQMRRIDDPWNLREALFSVISQARGHGVARARVDPLDQWLRAAGGAFDRRGADGGRR